MCRAPSTATDEVVELAKVAARAAASTSRINETTHSKVLDSVR
jgi:hypothetical protein